MVNSTGLSAKLSWVGAVEAAHKEALGYLFVFPVQPDANSQPRDPTGTSSAAVWALSMGSGMGLERQEGGAGTHFC